MGSKQQDRKRPAALLTLLWLVVLIGGGTAAWFYWPRGGQAATVDQLAEQALSDDQEAARVRAAVQLSAQGARTQLRDVVAQTRDPQVRATAAQALGDLADFQSVPELLRLCDDPSPLVRGRAGAALCSILGADFPFQAELPPADRAEVVRAMAKMYEQMRRSPPPKYQGQF